MMLEKYLKKEIKKELKATGNLTGDQVKSFKKMSKKAVKRILKDIFSHSIQQEATAILKKSNNSSSEMYWNPTHTTMETSTVSGKTDHKKLSNKGKSQKNNSPKMYGNYLRHDEYLKQLYRS